MLRYAKMTGTPVAQTNISRLHLGGRCSAAAIKNGESVDTSMGLTPLEGLGSSSAVDQAWCSLHYAHPDWDLSSAREGKTVFAAYAPKGSESRSNSAFGFSEPVLAAFEMRDELTVLNAYHRLQVQAPNDRHEIQLMCLVESPRAQPMIAIVPRRNAFSLNRCNSFP